MTKIQAIELAARDPNPAFRGTPAQLTLAVETLEGMARGYRAAGLHTLARQTLDRASVVRSALWMATAPIVIRPAVVGLDSVR